MASGTHWIGLVWSSGPVCSTVLAGKEPRLFGLSGEEVASILTDFPFWVRWCRVDYTGSDYGAVAGSWQHFNNLSHGDFITN